MPSNSLNKIIIGRIGAPYGIKGWIKVQSFTDPKSNISQYTKGWLQLGKNCEPYEALTKQLNQTILFKFPGYDDPENARKLTGGTLAIERAQLPPLNKDEYYWSDLEGLKVITTKGIVLGNIDHLIPTGANDVMVVAQAAKKQQLIPYIDEVVINIDLKNQELIVDWDEAF